MDQGLISALAVSLGTARRTLVYGQVTIQGSVWRGQACNAPTYLPAHHAAARSAVTSMRSMELWERDAVPVIACREHDEAAQEAQRALSLSRSQYHQIVILAGLTSKGVGAVAACVGAEVVSVSEAVASRLIEQPARSRPRAVSDVVRQIIAERSGHLVLLDRLEVLFETGLRVDPLSLLKQLSRDRPIIVVWPGKLDGEDLVYADPGHPEHRRDSAKDLMVVVANAQGTIA